LLQETSFFCSSARRERDKRYGAVSTPQYLLPRERLTLAEKTFLSRHPSVCAPLPQRGIYMNSLFAKVVPRTIVGVECKKKGGENFTQKKPGRPLPHSLKGHAMCPFSELGDGPLKAGKKRGDPRSKRPPQIVGTQNCLSKEGK